MSGTPEIMVAALSLRDHFAGLAMQALIGRERRKDLTDSQDVARDAYKFADDMLIERTDA